MTADEIMNLINNCGLPIALIVVGIVGFAYGCNKYFAPLVQSTINSNNEMVKNLEIITGKLSDISNKVVTVDSKTDTIITDMEILKDRIK